MSEIIDEKQFDTAVAEAQNSIAAYTHVFKTPLEYAGKVYDKITIDFGKMNGEDYIAVEQEIRATEGRVVVAAVYDTPFLMRLVCRASEERISYDALAKAPISDFTRIRDRARSFLLRSEL